jgi:hypothetical protein
MRVFTFDVKTWVTVRVEAADKAAALALIDDYLAGTFEGLLCLPEDGRRLEVESASVEGEPDLIDDEEAP